MLAIGLVHAIKIPHFARAVRMFDDRLAAPARHFTARLTGLECWDNVSKYFHTEIKFPGTNDHSVHTSRARAAPWWLENLLFLSLTK